MATIEQFDTLPGFEQLYKVHDDHGTERLSTTDFRMAILHAATLGNGKLKIFLSIGGQQNVTIEGTIEAEKV